MEDDDEFGDLYTDVLSQFQPPEPPNDPPPKPLIDLNLHTHDDDEFLFPAPNPNPNPIPKLNSTLSHHTETLVLNSTSSIPEPVLPQSSDSNRDSKPEVVRDDGFPEASASGVLESGGDGKPHEEVLNPRGRSGFELVLSERGGKDDSLVEKNEDLIDEEENFDKFDIEEAEEPVIPGVSDHGGGGNDWDSDSDDDLKIVLNESNHGDMLMDGLRGRGDEDDEDDDDDDPLVIVADSEPGIVPMEDREWGEDVGRVADGETKELGEATKVNGGAVVAPKTGFNGSFTYQPYHSQFKVSYVVQVKY